MYVYSEPLIKDTSQMRTPLYAHLEISQVNTDHKFLPMKRGQLDTFLGHSGGLLKKRFHCIRMYIHT